MWVVTQILLVIFLLLGIVALAKYINIKPRPPKLRIILTTIALLILFIGVGLTANIILQDKLPSGPPYHWNPITE